MLSPEEIQAARKQYGIGQSTTSQTGGSGFGSPSPVDHSARMERLRKLAAGESKSTATPETAGQSTNMFDKFKSGVQGAQQASQDFLVGQAKGVGSTITGIGELGAKALEGGYKAITGKEAVGKGGEMVEEVKKEHLAPTNTAQNIGFATEQLGEFLVPTGAAGKIEKAVEGSKALAKAPKAVQALAEVGAKSAVEGGEQALRTAAQEGDVNTNVKTAAVLGAAAPALEKTIGSAADKLGNFFFSRTVPTTLKEAAKDVSRELDVGEAVSKTGISLTKKSLMGKIRNEAVRLGEQLDDVITTHVAAHPSGTPIEALTGAVRESLGEKELANALKSSPVDQKAALEAIESRLSEYEKLYQGKLLSMDDIQKLKVSLGSSLEKVYQQALDTPVKAKALADLKLRTTLKKGLEAAIPAVKGINKELSPLLEAEGRMVKKGAYSGYLTDLLAGGFASGGIGQIVDDPVGFMKNFATGVIAKRLGTSTAAKTIAGKVTKDIGKFMSSPAGTQMIRRLIQGTKSSSDE